MDALAIVCAGHPGLRKPTRRISAEAFGTPALKKFIRGMVVTMRRARGVGLAANQVAVSANLMVLECRSNPRYPSRDDFPLEAFANLKILKRSKKQLVDWEGCLSVPGYRGLVGRAARVTFEAVTPDGRKVRRSVAGFHARVIQHEADHLAGHLYLDRMKGMRSLMHVDEFNRRFHVKITS